MTNSALQNVIDEQEERGLPKVVQHTPGPWDLEFVDQRGIIHKGGHIIAETKEFPVIAAGRDYDRQKAENRKNAEANAALIAAAPELLAALETVLREAREAGVLSLYASLRREKAVPLEKAFNAAGDIIAKAKAE
jgi:hypothetical protein